MFSKAIFIFSIFFLGCSSDSSSITFRKRDISRNNFNSDENIMLDILESYMDRYPKDDSYEYHLAQLIKKEIWPSIEQTSQINISIINAKCKKHGENILHLAYLIGDEQLIQCLFNSGAEFIIDATDNKGLTPLQKMVKEIKNEDIACKLFSSLFTNIKEDNIYGEDKDKSVEVISRFILKRNSTTGKLLKCFIEKSGRDISEEEANKHLLCFAEMENIEMVEYILDRTNAKADMKVFEKNRIYDRNESKGTLLNYLLSLEVKSEKLLSLIFEKGNYVQSIRYSDNLAITKYILEHSNDNVNDMKLLKEMLKAGIGKMKTGSKEIFTTYGKKNYTNNGIIMELLNKQKK